MAVTAIRAIEREGNLEPPGGVQSAMNWFAAGLVLHMVLLESLVQRVGVGLSPAVLVLAPCAVVAMARCGMTERPFLDDVATVFGPWGQQAVRWLFLPLWVIQSLHLVVGLTQWAIALGIGAYNYPNTYHVYPDSRIAAAWPLTATLGLAMLWPVRGATWIHRVATVIVLATPFMHREGLPEAMSARYAPSVFDLYGFERAIEVLSSFLLPLAAIGGRFSIGLGWTVVACFVATWTPYLGVHSGSVPSKLAAYLFSVVRGSSGLAHGKAILLALTSIPILRLLAAWMGDSLGRFRKGYVVFPLAAAMYFVPYPLNDSEMLPTAAVFPALFGVMAAARWGSGGAVPLRAALCWLAGLTVTILNYSMDDKATAPLGSFAVAFLTYWASGFAWRRRGLPDGQDTSPEPSGLRP